MLISLGDWDLAVNTEDFCELLRRIRVWSIYDNLDVLKSMNNTMTDRFEPVLMDDGEFREFGGVRFGAVNGIVALHIKESLRVKSLQPARRT